MTRLLIAAASAALLLPAAASAQSLGYYVATPAEGTKPAKAMTRGTAWFVRDGRMVAARAPQTPAKVCEMVARKVGRLQSFTVAGRTFGADELTGCNAAAPTNTAVAAK